MMDHRRNGGHVPQRHQRSCVDNWPTLGSVMTAKRTSPWLTVPPPPHPSAMTSFPTAPPMRSRHRRGGGPGPGQVRHFGQQYHHRPSGGPGSAGGAGYPYHGSDDHVTFHFRQFSEDSGFSSCGSSASSVADELEAPGHYGPLSRAPVWTERPARWSTSPVCGPQSGTVASVLAAGVSDSEETDHCESDDDSDSILMGRMKYNRFYSHLRKTPSWPNVPAPVSKLHPSKRHEKTNLKDKALLKHCGRDILDLGANLVTQFPLRATELPEKSLSLFLQNRSQYHRLGKFGTIEKLHFADCKTKCGFSFPVPPGENLHRLS